MFNSISLLDPNPLHVGSPKLQNHVDQLQLLPSKNYHRPILPTSNNKPIDQLSLVNLHLLHGLYCCMSLFSLRHCNGLPLLSWATSPDSSTPSALCFEGHSSAAATAEHPRSWRQSPSWWKAPNTPCTTSNKGPFCRNWRHEAIDSYWFQLPSENYSVPLK